MKFTSGLAFLCFFPCVAFSGTLTGNAHSVEQGILFTYQDLPNLLASCASHPFACGVGASDVPALSRIRRLSLSQSAIPQRVLFVSGTSAPALFDSNPTGLGHLASTAPTPGAPIYWNIDEFAHDAGRGKALSPELAQATEVLIHELGIQAGVGDEAYLDRLGASIKMPLEKQARELVFRNAALGFRLVAINDPALSTGARVYLFNDDHSSFLLSQDITPAIRCAGSGKSLLGWGVASWAIGSVTNPASGEKTSVVTLPVDAKVNVRCKDTRGVESVSSRSIRFDLNFTNSDGSSSFGRIRIE